MILNRYKVFMVRRPTEAEGMEKLINEHARQGWRVHSAFPGTGQMAGAYVLMEKKLNEEESKGFQNEHMDDSADINRANVRARVRDARAGDTVDPNPDSNLLSLESFKAGDPVTAVHVTTQKRHYGVYVKHAGGTIHVVKMDIQTHPWNIDTNTWSLTKYDDDLELKLEGVEICEDDSCALPLTGMETTPKSGDVSPLTHTDEMDVEKISRLKEALDILAEEEEKETSPETNVVSNPNVVLIPKSELKGGKGTTTGDTNTNTLTISADDEGEPYVKGMKTVKEEDKDESNV